MLARIFPAACPAFPHGSGNSLTPAVADDRESDTAHTELNHFLETLCELFPEADLEDLRERLLNSSRESRLYLVTESLLKIPSRGTRRNVGQSISNMDRFRSRQYKEAVKSLLCSEFKGLSESTIQAVMVENNHDYCRSRTTLAEIAAKSWRYSVSVAAKSWRYSVSAFFRRKRSEPTNISELMATGCEELDAELRELRKDKIQAQIDEDRKMSALLDEAEHAAASDLVGCETCYSDFSWNEIAACSEGHFICHGCLIRSVQESLYGQGQCIVGEKSTIRCLSATAAPLCTACIPPDILAKVVPAEMLRAMEDKAAMENLDRSGLALIRCPFCSYAEVDELQPYHIKQSAEIIGISALIILFVLFPGLSMMFLALPLFTHIVKLLLPWEAGSAAKEIFESLSPQSHWENAVRRIQLKRRGSLFRCQSERCKRQSCIQCSKEWTSFHKCFEKEEDNVRIHIEKAMANAVKRTCPICRISFVKADGCNKLTCVCGYIMCYICRADIRKEGYKHFCQHFRQVPGTACSDCDRCDLYVQEDEESAIREAAIKAEEEYFKNHEVPATWKYTGRAIGPLNRRNSEVWFNIHKLQPYFDRLVEMIVEEA
ncbi:hypothetical protein BDZ91DRAFT_730620 [Kalaharituber pfeilii]|nr:hypothetical protein BDZ91DRAFT_730620 [Kalaharituber pfeilii]